MIARLSLSRAALALSCLAVLTFATDAAAQEKPFSGPQPGESLAPFKVLQVLSPEKSEVIQIAKPKKDAETTVLMFMHKLSEPAIGLMMTVEWYATKQKEVTSYYIMLHEDREKARTMAQRWAQRPFFSASPMSISVDGLEGPGRYGLNRNVDMTVLVAKGNKVTHNFAINGPNNTDAPAILTAISKTIGAKKAPSLDQIRKEMRADRDRRRQNRIKQNPVYKLAPNDQLGRLMVAMLFREQVNEAAIKELSVGMTKWAGDDKKKKAALAAYAKKVLKGGFEINRYAREALEEFSKME